MFPTVKFNENKVILFCFVIIFDIVLFFQNIDANF